MFTSALHVFVLRTFVGKCCKTQQHIIKNKSMHNNYNNHIKKLFCDLDECVHTALYNFYFLAMKKKTKLHVFFSKIKNDKDLRE